MYLMFTISYENKSNLLKYIISCSAILLRYSHVNLANQILFAFNDRYYFMSCREVIVSKKTVTIIFGIDKQLAAVTYVFHLDMNILIK